MRDRVAKHGDLIGSHSVVIAPPPPPHSLILAHSTSVAFLITGYLNNLNKLKSALLYKKREKFVVYLCFLTTGERVVQVIWHLYVSKK